ncbi:SDR family oxidoreductase [Cohnella cellulosilytica]|uniref:SDR family oxidoreductase n=1 Tax=Cohnella cellulosilytica TaxID=986710 RepID=A0ABW2FHU6_9BACL
MKDKVCMVTGANSGIGFAAAKGLAERGAAVVMVCRNRERGEEARQEIVRQTGNERIELLLCDLSSLRSVRDLSEAFRARWDRLDVLVNNAGGLFDRPQTSADGFELTFAVNYLAPFLLTHLLLDRLQASDNGRIVNVASVMQAKTLDLDAAIVPQAPYSGFSAYRTAKLAVIMATYFMAGRLADSGIAVNALHPGVIYTPQSTRGVPGFLRPLAKLFMSPPERGARLILQLAASPEAGASSGKYYAGSRAVSTVPVSYDSRLQRELYERSLQWTGLPEDAIVLD